MHGHVDRAIAGLSFDVNGADSPVELSVHIAGAGLGGLAAALALSLVGASVRVSEQAIVLDEVGAGIQLSPNAMRVARALGVEKQIIDAGFAPGVAVIRDYRTGKKYLNAPLVETCAQRYGAPFVQIHRADLHSILLRAAMNAGVAVETGEQVTGYEIAGPRAAFLSDGGRCDHADLLIGADGLKSHIQRQMLGPEAPEFTGQVAWRGLIPASALPRDLIAPDATVWAGPGRHFVTYYVRGGDLVNFVAVQERTDWREESWAQPGDPAELRAAFSGWRPEVTALIDQVDQCFLWALFDRKPLDRWSDGPVALLGDACHPMPPFMAQGAAMAFEDAYVLSKCVEAGADIHTAVRRYEDIRKPRATKMQARARANADLFHMKGIGAQARLLAASVLPGRAALTPLDWIYGYDATLTPKGSGWS